MESLNSIAIIIAIVLSIMGILGGLLSLPENIQKFRKARLPHGIKGTGWIVINRRNSEENIEVRFLIFDDPVHALSGFLKYEGAQVIAFNPVGIYFDVVVIYPPNTDLWFEKVRKNLS